MSSPLFHASFAFGTVGLLALTLGGGTTVAMPAVLFAAAMDLDLSFFGARHLHRVELLLALSVTSIFIPFLIPFMLACGSHLLLDLMDREGAFMLGQRLTLPAPRLLRGIELASLPWSIVLLLLCP
jgi:hypothetical protein